MRGSLRTVTFNLPCHNSPTDSVDNRHRYCIKYRDGSHQEIVWFELIIILLGIMAIFGFLRASNIHRKELHTREGP